MRANCLPRRATACTRRSTRLSKTQPPSSQNLFPDMRHSGLLARQGSSYPGSCVLLWKREHANDVYKCGQSVRHAIHCCTTCHENITLPFDTLCLTKFSQLFVITQYFMITFLLPAKCGTLCATSCRENSTSLFRVRSWTLWFFMDYTSLAPLFVKMVQILK